MPRSPEYDFSKLEDQQKFKGYSRNDREYGEKIKNAAYEEAMELKEMVESGEAADYNDAEAKLVEKILKEREETKNWIKNDFCDPEKIPGFLLEKYSPSEILYLLKEENNDQLRELLEGDEEINKIVNSIDYTQDEGVVKTPAFAYDSGSTIEKKGRFLEINKEQREEMREMIDDLTPQDQRMGLFLMTLDEKHHGKWGCGGGFGNFKNPSSCGGCVDGKVNLESVFGKNIPYLKYKGDRVYHIEPFDNYRGGYWHNEVTSQGAASHETANAIEILAFYGKEKGAQLLDNINKVKDDIEMIKAERQLNEDVIALLGKNYKSIKEKMPEVIESLKGMDPSSLKLEDIDIKNKIIILKGSRSEYGKGGGIAYFSRVIVCGDGQFQEKEYQWRDRWSASNDKPQYSFNNLKIKKIKKEKDSLSVEVEAIPSDRYSSTFVNFSFESAADKEKFDTLSIEEQAEFKNFVESEIEKINAEKFKMWENKPQMVATYPAGMTMPRGTPTYVNYERPDVTQKVVDLKKGLGSFVIKEQIDAVASDPQLRFEVYITRHKKGTEMAYEDHAYLKQEGDASITGLRISKGRVMFTTRKGKQEIE